MIRKVSRILLVLWAGSLWSLTWVTSTLFSAQADRHLAGVLAGRLFSIETYLGVAVAALALLLPGRATFVWGYVAALLLALNEWALRPVMALARTHGSAFGLTFGAWHGVSAGLYLAASIALFVVVWRQESR